MPNAATTGIEVIEEVSHIKSGVSRCSAAKPRCTSGMAAIGVTALRPLTDTISGVTVKDTLPAFIAATLTVDGRGRIREVTAISIISMGLFAARISSALSTAFRGNRRAAAVCETKDGVTVTRATASVVSNIKATGHEVIVNVYGLTGAITLPLCVKALNALTGSGIIAAGTISVTATTIRTFFAGEVST